MSREQLKSVTLISLFGICVLLVSQIWSNISLDLFNYSKQGRPVEFEKIQIDQIISPQGFVYNFGGKSHTVNYSDKYQVWKEAKPTLINILSQGNQLEIINQKEWTGINNYRSIRLILPYAINRNDLLDLLEVGLQRTEIDIFFNEILIVLNERNTIYFANKELGNYYALTGSYHGDELNALLNIIENSEQTFYETIEDHYGLVNILNDELTTYDVNGTLMPRNQVEVIDVIKVNKEIEIADESEDTQDSIQKYADYAFDRSFDFVNRLQDDDGSIVFIYGYGERALKLGANGEIEYKRKLDGNLAGSPLNLTDSLKVAIDFVGKYGGVPNNIYLTSFTTTGESELGYRFTFGYRVQGYPVINSELNSGNAIEIEVYGRQVLSFKRLVRTYSKVADIPEIMGQQYKINDVIGLNSDRIHKDYQEAGNSTFSKNQIYEILQQIKGVNIVYYSDVTLNSERLIPAWQIQIGSNIYYINMHSGNIIRTVKTKS